MGNFHGSTFDSLVCACLPCAGDPGSGTVVGKLCNPGDRICGPEPRRAPDNKICFTGVGDYTMTKGRRSSRTAIFRVDVEDHSEPGGTNGPAPPDHYHIQLWLVPTNATADDAFHLALREAISCGAHVADSFVPQVGGHSVAPDIDDGGDLFRGNHQFHPEINKKACSTTSTLRP